MADKKPAPGIWDRVLQSLSQPLYGSAQNDSEASQNLESHLNPAPSSTSSGASQVYMAKQRAADAAFRRRYSTPPPPPADDSPVDANGYSRYSGSGS